MEIEIKKDVAIVDSGSGYMKAGLANATSPSVTAPQVLARPKFRYLLSFTFLNMYLILCLIDYHQITINISTL